MYAIYNILIIITGLLTIPYLIVKIIADSRYRAGIKERLGFISIIDKTKPRFLVHASSVGEVNVAYIFIKELLTRNRDCEIVLTAMTPEGYFTAKEKLKGMAQVSYFCLDYRSCVKRFLNKIDPDMVFIIETEFWPNFLKALTKRDIKTVIINGRISERSFNRYKLLKGFVKSVLKNVDSFFVQLEIYKTRLEFFTGGSADIKVTGNIKFDIDDSSFNIDDELLLKINALDYIVAASTHDDEEKKILSIFPKIKEKAGDIKLVIAPRHIKRCHAIEALLHQMGLSYIKRTQFSQDVNPGDYDVILVDTIGDLVTFFKSAKLVFMGGSLVNVGGHNVMEPAYFSKPVIFGKYMQNFADASELLLNEGGGILVRDVLELKDRVLYLLSDKDLPAEKKLEKIGRTAKSALSKNKGALERTMAQISW
jgi:3-deoxy-D-manno-octulosonic-acid transferase